MPNNSKTISRIATGMIRGSHPINMEDGQYEFMLNGTVENFDGIGPVMIQNDGSNLLCSGFPAGFFVLGFANIVELNRIIWFSVNPTTGESQIGETRGMENCREYASNSASRGGCEDCGAMTLNEDTPLEDIDQIPCCTYTALATDLCLGFDRNYPIDSVEYRLIDCGVEVVFANDVNGARYIQFEFENDDQNGPLVIKQNFYKVIGYNDDDCETPIYGTELDCNKLKIQPSISTGCIEFVGLVPGGSNRAGVYQFFLSYATETSDKLGAYASSTNPIPIFTRDITFETNYITDQAIQLRINNLSLEGPHQYFNLAVAKTIDNVTSFFLVGTFPITQKTITYTGNEEAELELTIGDIFQRFVYYKNVGHVTQSNGMLFLANVSEYPKINVQRWANKLAGLVQWQTIAIPEPVYRKPENVQKYRSYMRDEVYPLGLQPIFDNGEEGAVGHVPGRPANEVDLQIIDNADVFPNTTCSGTTVANSNRRWQVYNTGSLIGGELAITDGCAEKCYEFGDMAYWESIERYPLNPEVWGELCGQPIRHHKFPDSVITHIHNNEGAVANFDDNNLVFPIGFKLDPADVKAALEECVTEGLIAREDADRIVGFRIVRGNRVGNKSIQAKGLLYDMNQYVRKDGGDPIDNTETFFANFPYNDLRDNVFITDEFNNYDDHDDPEGPDLPFTFSNRYTFHSPDTHFNQPTIGTELKLETNEYGEAEGQFDVARGQAKQKLLSNASYYLALSAGIIAAIMRTEEKVCTEYTVRGVTDISTQSYNAGITGTGYTTITSGSGSIGPNFETPRNITPVVTYDPETGVVGADNAQDVTKRTCQGSRGQYYNPVFTAIKNPILAPFSVFLALVSRTADFLQYVFQEMNIFLELIKSLVPYRDWHVQYNSVGKYNAYHTVPNNGSKRRQIANGAYLKPENALVNEGTNPVTGASTSIRINNLNRESSLYLRVSGDPFDAPQEVDESRVALDNDLIGCRLSTAFRTPISSYYASMKNFVPDQYGNIYNVDYLLTESCAFDINASGDTGCKTIFGGDTFMDRFALKIKVPFFNASLFGFPEGTPFNYSLHTNLAFPRHYFNSDLTLGSEIDIDGSGGIGIIGDFVDLIGDILNPAEMPTLLGRPKSIRDCKTNKFFYQNGYIYLYSYGIPYFIVESDINVAYRHAENNRERDFYPRTSDVNEWLQEEVVPIREDNYYFYNRTYSKQNRENPFVINPPSFEPDRDCRVDYPNRIIYSTGSNWGLYKANDLVTIPLDKGAIVSVDGIENETVIIRTTNGLLIFKTVLRTQVDGQTVQTGNGGLFANPPQEFADTTLGYIGTQHKAILHTEYGHIWPDVKRGQIFNLAAGASGVDEISKNGMKDFFKENLPFRLKRDFPTIADEDLDNAYNNVGIAMAFDKRYNRMFLTKRDYKRKDSSVLYDAEEKEFYRMEGDIRVPVRLGDKRYFSDCSFTVSYNFFTKSWISFHSFIPNYYLNFIDSFGSGQDDGFWLHNLTNSSYQVYYGKLHPFIVEGVVKFTGQQTVLNSIEFDTEVRRYSDEFDYVIKSKLPGFNKATIYNDRYNSGLLNVVKTDKGDLSNIGVYPIRNFDSWDVEIALANYKWRINQFYNLVREEGEVPIWKYDPNNADKKLNPQAFNYDKDDFSLSRLRGQWFRTRLTNDNLSNYKIIHKFAINNQTAQFK